MCLPWQLDEQRRVGQSGPASGESPTKKNEPEVEFVVVSNSGLCGQNLMRVGTQGQINFQKVCVPVSVCWVLDDLD